MKNNFITFIMSLLAIFAITGSFIWAASQGGSVVFGVPVLFIVVIFIFALQWLVFIPAYVLQSEKFFDLTGSVTFILSVFIALLLTRDFDARTLILVILVTIWALRLGIFLHQRVHKTGKDARFDELKNSFFRYFITWTMQGMWVSFTLAAALVAITSQYKQELGFLVVSGLLIWLVGFLIEAIADAQKMKFKNNPQNKNNYIQSGLWATSRHPNYFGEILAWLGIAVIAVPVFQGWQWIAMLSPVFVIVLLTGISGVPILEKRADEKWGDDKAYQDYKKNTPILIPKIRQK